MKRIKNINKYKRIVLAAIVLLSFTISGNAQSFMMSSVGMMPGTSSNATALNFKSNTTCIDVQTGIAVFSGVRSFGTFAINCEVTQEFNALGIKMFPNPVKTLTKVKFINTPPLKEEFNLTVWTTEGAMLSTRKETGYNIFQGVMLDMSNLIAGTYVLKIESTKYVDAIKFIKVN